MLLCGRSKLATDGIENHQFRLPVSAHVGANLLAIGGSGPHTIDRRIAGAVVAALRSKGGSFG